MERRLFLKSFPPLAAARLSAAGFAAAPDASFPEIPALEEPHFPSRLHQFVWRNWELANLDRMARVTGASTEQIEALGRSMGLPAKPALSEDYLKRIYITVIRQNWHLLPESQIQELLGWDRQRFEFTLKEDDFLDHKLGRVKPACDPLRYQAPRAEESEKAARIRALLASRLSSELAQPAAPRFAFTGELGAIEDPLTAPQPAPPGSGGADLGQSWVLEIEGGASALRQALDQFHNWLAASEAGAAKLRFEVVVDARSEVEADSYRILVQRGRVRIEAKEERCAIRALYQLRGEMAQRNRRWIPEGDRTIRAAWSPHYLYSYFALYGDPLLEGDAAGLPDGYLDRAAACGVDGVWIQGVLNTLAPSARYPEFGASWQTRIRNLNQLVERAARFGIRVFLYLNEPRAMPAPFFRDRPEVRGEPFQDVFAMCTSTPEVREWLRSSLTHVFREVPGLGGLFSITMSENHTNCFSHGGAWGDRIPEARQCPRCSRRTGADTLAELITTFRDGVRGASRDAQVISYDWGWGTPLAAQLIPKLPKDSGVLSISEWSVPVFRGGVKTEVGEYSMSVMGPGPRASANWRLAKESGLAALAKTQFNNTWEISAVPYIPVLPLVLEHCEKLLAAGVSGVMSSWTCGGYPSPNLRAAASMAATPRPSVQQVLEQEAGRIYGPAGAAPAVRAWRQFSKAFQSFPYGVAIYVLPVQHGPANLLRLRDTKLKPGMILLPYDNYKAWSGAYPPAVVLSLLSQLAADWKLGLPDLAQAARLAPAGRRRAASLELAIANTCALHFESAANQMEFYLLRDEPEAKGKARQDAIRRRMIRIAEREQEIARQQFRIARGEPLIGYEASNHYYYTPWDLVEKILNCENVIAQLRAGAAV